MDILDFLGLKECDQWELFWEDCEEFGEQDGIDARYRLFKLYGFYVELTTVPDGEKAMRMMPFKSGPRLERWQGIVEIGTNE